MYGFRFHINIALRLTGIVFEAYSSTHALTTASQED